ncbi:MAG: carboxypeptidase M32 [Candidatus Thorarchaeota archaeon]|jgi:carboxypeptidase Taq
MSAYDELLSKVKEITLLGTSAAILNWDMQTYMPPRGAELRGEQLSVISRLIHRMSTDEEFGELISKAENTANSSDIEKQRNLYLLRRQYDEATKLPEDLVAELSKQQAATSNSWMKTKPKSDWKSYMPELQKMLELSLKRAEALLELRGLKNLYDVVIDDFESKMTSDEISKVFNELRGPLVDLTRKLGELSENTNTDIVKRKVPIEIQKKIAHELTGLIGYDTSSSNAGGRIDDVQHPFTTGYYDDVRITMRYSEIDPVAAVLTILHEAGHALYEQNLKQEWKFQPIGAASSFGVHESISRFFENIIGRSTLFWKSYLPKYNKATSNVFDNIDTTEFVRALNLVKPSKIRVSADEVTYSLHIIIRFEIERDLFAGKIEVSELPEVWNQKYLEYLDQEINNYGEGVMQDSHWSSGYFGYFPSYALGNIYGGMWMETLDKDSPKWRESISKGDMEPVSNWLVTKIMNQSNLFEPGVLIQNITGKKLTAQPFISYLDKKYAQLFE